MLIGEFNSSAGRDRDADAHTLLPNMSGHGEAGATVVTADGYTVLEQDGIMIKVC